MEINDIADEHRRDRIKERTSGGRIMIGMRSSKPSRSHLNISCSTGVAG
jgi:hypothetical protein